MDRLESYYQRNETNDGCLFQVREKRYLSLVESLRAKNPDFLARAKPIFLQAGFFSRSIVDFRRFCQQISPDCHVLHLDKRVPYFSFGGNVVRADLSLLSL